MSTREICAIFSANLQRYMAENKMTQRELAAKLGAGVATVNDWATGKRIPRSPMLQKLTEVFHCKLSQLLTNADTVPQQITASRQDLLHLVDTMSDAEVERLLQIARLVRGE